MTVLHSNGPPMDTRIILVVVAVLAAIMVGIPVEMKLIQLLPLSLRLQQEVLLIPGPGEEWAVSL